MQTYFMVGAGGTGSQFLPAGLTYLRAFHAQRADPEYQLVIADGDEFEPGNMARQLFTTDGIGRNKAEAMLEMYPGHPIIAVSRNVGRTDIERMVQDGDIVLMCADNYSVRALMVERIKELDNAVYINGGNGLYDGSVQLWVRENGENVTPPITFHHPEIVYRDEDDRSAMTCAQVAALPGGGQTIIANMTAANNMLTALWRYHEGLYRTGWTELQYDLRAGETHHIDMRTRKNWTVNP